jgi:hypothetical protein
MVRSIFATWNERALGVDCGTSMTRISRPPGFDMTYRPRASVSFGPPIGVRLPSLVYLAVAIALVAFVTAGSFAASGTWIFRYVVEADENRWLGSRTLAGLVLLSAVASVLRARMRGVVVHPDGVETRDLLTMGWPRVRRFAWPQIDKIVLDAGPDIAIDLWDGRRELLPRVGDQEKLALLLERVAMARAIPMSGATGKVDPPEDDD